MTRLIPCADRILIRPDPEKGDQVTASGLIIPQLHKERPTTGTVLEIGPDINPLAIGVGDRVLFGKYAGTDLELDNLKVTIVKEADVLAIVEEEKVKEDGNDPII